MPTRNINLTSKQDAYIDSVIESGEYQNASEAIRDALRALQQRRREDALRLKALRASIRTGIEALERGDYTEVGESGLGAYLERLTAAPRKKSAR